MGSGSLRELSSNDDEHNAWSPRTRRLCRTSNPRQVTAHWAPPPPRGPARLPAAPARVLRCRLPLTIRYSTLPTGSTDSAPRRRRTRPRRHSGGRRAARRAGRACRGLVILEVRRVLELILCPSHFELGHCRIITARGHGVAATSRAAASAGRNRLERAHVDCDILLADAEEPAHAHDQPEDLAVLIEQHVIHIADVRIVRTEDVATFEFGENPLVRTLRRDGLGGVMRSGFGFRSRLLWVGLRERAGNHQRTDGGRNHQSLEHSGLLSSLFRQGKEAFLVREQLASARTCSVHLELAKGRPCCAAKWPLPDNPLNFSSSSQLDRRVNAASVSALHARDEFACDGGVAGACWPPSTIP